MSKSAKGLVAWAEAAFAAGWVYWYGTCAYKCTASLLASKTKQYPEHYGDKRQATYKRHISEGRSCADCIGLIKGYAWDTDGDVETRGNKYGGNGMPDKSSSGMYKAAKIKGKIATMPEIPGALVWTKNQAHVGVYVGDGMVVEARGFSYGIQRNELSARSFTHWGLCPYLEYTAEQVETAQKAAGTTATNTTTAAKKSGDTLRKGDKGDAVKEMQNLLIAAGCKLEKHGADGDFGAETLEALKAYQTTHGLTADGVCGPLTWESLRSNQSASQGQETADKGMSETPAVKMPAPEAAERRTIKWGYRGDDVKEMQELLIKAGCKLEKHGADGHYGAETLEALKAYQTANSLTPDGLCGPKTWAKLLKV